MPGVQRRIRRYHSTGMYRGRNGPPTPQQRQTAATLRDELVTDHMRGDPTAGQRVILDLLTFAKIRHADATTYLAGMEHPWVDRRSRRAWTIVHDLGRLERHIARLVQALVDPALERRPQPIETLADYAARVNAEAETNLTSTEKLGPQCDDPRTTAAHPSEFVPPTDAPAGNNPDNPDNPPSDP